MRSSCQTELRLGWSHSGAKAKDRRQEAARNTFMHCWIFFSQIAVLYETLTYSYTLTASQRKKRLHLSEAAASKQKRSQAWPSVVWHLRQLKCQTWAVPDGGDIVFRSQTHKWQECVQYRQQIWFAASSQRHACQALVRQACNSRADRTKVCPSESILPNQHFF